MSQTEFYEIKKLILEQREKLEKLELLIPEKFDISFIVKKTGLTRQGIRKKLLIKFKLLFDNIIIINFVKYNQFPCPYVCNIEQIQIILFIST